MYLDITEDINIGFRKIDNILSFKKGTGILIAMDSKARSSIWHDIRTNNRGKDMEEYLSANNLFVMKKDSERTTFENSRGKSNIDLTITYSHLLPILHKWECSEEESCSDHRIFTFSIGKYTPQNKENIYEGTKLIIKEENFKYFEEHIIRELVEKYLKKHHH
jgi:hypothetical protein